MFRKKSEGPAEKKAPWKEVLDVVIWALVMAFLARSFVVQAFRIPSGSMEDTLLIGDFLFVNKFLYGAKIPFTDVRMPGLREPEPGDIIVWRPEDEKQDYIKRCVAVQGQEVQIRDGVLYRDGEAIEEGYVKYMFGSSPPGWISPRDWGPFTVPEGEILLLGDNRDNSRDGRQMGFHAWRETPRGKVTRIYWSWDGEAKRPRWGRVGRVPR